jgi:hypothetical protein
MENIESIEEEIDDSENISNPNIEKINYFLGKKSKINYKHYSNLVLYCIETITDNPFLYFLMMKNVNELLQLPSMPSHKIKSFMKKNFTKSKYHEKGCISYHNENYVFYEIKIVDEEFFPSLSTDIWWKVTPFEMIYSKEVLYFPIDYKFINFFIQHPNLLFLLDENMNKYEIPIIVYLGIGESELNEQLFLNTINHYKGEFSKGYYFKTFEKAYEDCMVDYETPNQHILKLINYKYLDDFIYTGNNGNNEDDIVIIKNNKFYFRDIFIGDVPENCKKNNYTLESYDDDYIYLRTDKENQCTKTIYESRKENGVLLRYILIQNNNYIGPEKPKGYDSYSHNSMFMVKNQDCFSCLSYHIVKKDDFNTNEIKIK